jgi:hypothetical protein
MASADQVRAPDGRGADLRRHPRRRVLHKALIVFDDGNCSMGCQILDLSDRGAKLMPADIILCPKEFLLKTQNDEPRHCVVIWRKSSQIGVRYLEESHHTEISDDRRHRIRRRALQKALIVFNNGRSSMQCQIIDRSDTGAKLVPADIFLCPREFMLNPPNSGPRRCMVMWRKGSQIGVRYV